jgi:hypothetical protein
MMKITFDNTKTEKVNVTFWLQSSTNINNKTTINLTCSFKNSENSIQK